MGDKELNWLQRLFQPVDGFFLELEKSIQPSATARSMLGDIDAAIWGLFLIFLLVGTGLYLVWHTRFIQLRQLRHAIALVRGKYDDPEDEGDITHFQALSTALSATIGTGNIAGVATAIAGGGPGAIFWMWVTGLLGSGIKFASCTLGMKYRVMHEDGSASGGPMYYLEHGIGRRWLWCIVKLAVVVACFYGGYYVGVTLFPGVSRWLAGGGGLVVAALVIGLLWLLSRPLEAALEPLCQSLRPTLDALYFHKWLAIAFALFAAVASFGIGNMIQANSLALPLYDDIGLPRSLAGVLIAVLAGAVIIGGIKRIGRVTSKLTPIMAVIYVLGALVILIKNAHLVPGAFELIFEHAFNPTAAAGGFAGAAVAQTIRLGVARGIFSNESGLGSAPIAHAAAKTREPVREGLVAMIGPFVDTLVVCTMTALVIVTTGAYMEVDPETGKGLTSSLLSKQAFETGMTGGGWIVTIGILLFAFSTIIGWSYYGDRSVEYLAGRRGVHVYRWIYILLIPIGAAMKVEVIWTVSDITNGLMAFPNLVALLFLTPALVVMMRDYFSREHVPIR